MRREWNEKQLLLTGKAWEIKHVLKQMVKAESGRPTLDEYLKKKASLSRY